MTERPLPQGGRDRQIFIVGLRRMSAQCDVPDLTPECPFYEVTSQGASCGEQCIDLLAEHRGEAPAAPQHSLGGDLAAVQRPAARPRRSPEPDQRPFDAAEIALQDRDRPIEQRSTTSLIRDLSDLIRTAPTYSPDVEDRRYRLTVAYRELGRRGVDADLLIRCGLALKIGWSVAVFLVAQEVLTTQGEREEVVNSLPEPDARWLALLKEARRRDGAESGNLLDYAIRQPTFARRVRNWVAIAPLDRVFQWEAPDVAEFFDSPKPVWTREEIARAAWLRDRFTQTYVHEWREDSLAMEWDYLHGQREGCCPPEVMRERRTDVDEVARRLAHAHQIQWRDRTDAAPERQFTAQDFAFAAAENLQAGRHDAAAAIFAALLSLSPDDTDANNNYGFCILPTDTERALGHLERAAATVSDKAVELTNSTNRVLALHLLGRDDEARELAELSLALPPVRTPSFLWRHGPEKLELTGLVSPRAHLEQLYGHLREGTRWATCRCAQGGDALEGPTGEPSIS